MNYLHLPPRNDDKGQNLFFNGNFKILTKNKTAARPTWKIVFLVYERVASRVEPNAPKSNKAVSTLSTLLLSEVSHGWDL